MEIDFSKEIVAKKGKAPLNKPFRLPSGSKKKFGVYVKNDKGNIVMVKFGDPNMSIKRDNPERRKAYRARHGCSNPGPKWKANYWSCRMWSSKPVSKITGSEDVTLEAEIQAGKKGLWYNIQQKKKRMGKNYRPAKPGSPNYPDKDAFKKAQAEDYNNENYEWDGETEFDQNEFLKLDSSLSQILEVDEEMESPEEELREYKSDFLEMIIGSINSIKTNAENILNKINDPKIAENLTEPFLQQYAALAEDYMITIHNYVMFNRDEENGEMENIPNESEAQIKNQKSHFQIGDKVRNINANCKHFGSEGIVTELKELPEDMGYAVIYKTTNDGSTWKKGDMLGKTEIQLKKIDEDVQKEK